MFTKAIVSAPGSKFASGLTSVDLGVPELERAIQQHETYCMALASCGLELIRLPADDNHPDSTFVEDTAILTSRGAVITRPGAASRLAEVDRIATILPDHFREIHTINAPGTVDGGDICEAGEHFFIGISRRTNEDGATQLAQILNSFGYSSSLIDIRGVGNILHLKSGLAYLGGKHLVVIEELKPRPEFSGYDLICPNLTEEYAANCVTVNEKILIAEGFPAMKQQLEVLGYQTIPLEMSEFQKMDGGLSCLSLRF